jgi:hypothetical protein
VQFFRFLSVNTNGIMIDETVNYLPGREQVQAQANMLVLAGTQALAQTMAQVLARALAVLLIC